MNTPCLHIAEINCRLRLRSVRDKFAGDLYLRTAQSRPNDWNMMKPVVAGLPSQREMRIRTVRETNYLLANLALATDQVLISR
jgi:hypothetical protein